MALLDVAPALTPIEALKMDAVFAMHLLATSLKRKLAAQAARPARPGKSGGAGGWENHADGRRTFHITSMEQLTGAIKGGMF